MVLEPTGMSLFTFSPPPMLRRPLPLYPLYQAGIAWFTSTLLSAIFIYILPVGSWKYRDGTTCTVRGWRAPRAGWATWRTEGQTWPPGWTPRSARTSTEWISARTWTSPEYLLPPASSLTVQPLWVITVIFLLSLVEVNQAILAWSF